MFYIICMASVQSVGYNNPYYNERYNNQVFAQNQSANSNDAASILGLMLLSKGVSFATTKVANKLMRGKEYTSFNNVKNVVNDMLSKNNLDTKVYFVDMNNISEVSRRSGIREKDLLDVAQGKNAFFADSHKIAVAPKSKPSLIQHELGHAINSKKTFTKLLQNSRMLALYTPTALIFANMISKRLSKNPEKETFVEKHAGVLGFMAYLPTVIEEGLASIKGIQAAKKTLGGQNVKLGALRKNYLLAWLTYLLGAVGLGIASKLSVKTGVPMGG